MEGVAEHFVIPIFPRHSCESRNLDVGSTGFLRAQNDEGLSAAMEPKFWDFAENDSVFCIMQHPQWGDYNSSRLFLIDNRF